MSRKENKKIEIILTIIKIICIIFLILVIGILALQRFSNNEKTIGGIRVFNVATESMVPKYKVGDVLVVKEIDASKLKVGDDITYIGKVGTFAGRVVTHQIVKIDDSSGRKIITTKGIANDVEDPSIDESQVFGKVIYKCVIVSLLTKLMNNITAFYIIVFIPIGFLIFLQIRDRIDEKREENYDDEENEEDDDIEDSNKE